MSAAATRRRPSGASAINAEIPTVPAAPLFAAMARAEASIIGLGRAMDRLSGRRDAGERALQRARARGRLTIWTADLACCALDLHPNDVWGRDWPEPDEDEEDRWT